MALVIHKDTSNKQMDSSKYVRYTPEQVEALERVYAECPKPSSLRRQQLIRECPILSNIEPKQIKVWFQNRRYIVCLKTGLFHVDCLTRLFSPLSLLIKNDNISYRKPVLCFLVCLFLASAILLKSFGLGSELLVHLGKELNSCGRWVYMEMMLLVEKKPHFPTIVLYSVTLLRLAISFRRLLQYGTGSPDDYKNLTFSLAFLG